MCVCVFVIQSIVAISVFQVLADRILLVTFCFLLMANFSSATFSDDMKNIMRNMEGDCVRACVKDEVIQGEGVRALQHFFCINKRKIILD